MYFEPKDKTDESFDKLVEHLTLLYPNTFDLNVVELVRINNNNLYPHKYLYKTDFAFDKATKHHYSELKTTPFKKFKCYGMGLKEIFLRLPLTLTYRNDTLKLRFDYYSLCYCGPIHKIVSSHSVLHNYEDFFTDLVTLCIETLKLAKR